MKKTPCIYKNCFLLLLEGVSLKHCKICPITTICNICQRIYCGHKYYSTKAWVQPSLTERRALHKMQRKGQSLSLALCFISKYLPCLQQSCSREKNDCVLVSSFLVKKYLIWGGPKRGVSSVEQYCLTPRQAKRVVAMQSLVDNCKKKYLRKRKKCTVCSKHFWLTFFTWLLPIEWAALSG